MKINIYYGGRGLLDDPTLYVLNKMEECFKRTSCDCRAHTISMSIKMRLQHLPQTYERRGWNYSGDDSGMARNWRIHAAVSWMRAGFMETRKRLSVTYMQPIVMSTTYGEREGEMTLCQCMGDSWRTAMLQDLCGYVEDTTSRLK